MIQHYDAETYDFRRSVGYLLKRAYALMLDGLEPAFAEHGFTYMQYVILMQLRSGAVLNLRDFCIHFRHDSGALTRVVDQLAERGLLERSRCDQDRRKVNLRLTPLGYATLERLIPMVVDRLNRALADFSSAEIDEMVRLLGKFIGGIERELLRLHIPLQAVPGLAHEPPADSEAAP